MRTEIRAATLLLLSVTTALAACGPGVLAPGGEPAWCPEPTYVQAPPRGTADTVFIALSEAALPAEQARRVADIRARPATARVDVARLVDDLASRLEPGRTVELNVSPVQSFTAVGERVEVRSPDDLSWSGGLVDDHGAALLVLRGTSLTGTVTSVPPSSPPLVYAFEPVGGGVHAIVCVGAGRLPD